MSQYVVLYLAPGLASTPLFLSALWEWTWSHLLLPLYQLHLRPFGGCSPLLHHPYLWVSSLEHKVGRLRICQIAAHPLVVTQELLSKLLMTYISQPWTSLTHDERLTNLKAKPQQVSSALSLRRHQLNSHHSNVLIKNWSGECHTSILRLLNRLLDPWLNLSHQLS